MEATAKELRFNSKKLLETVGRGEEVVITFRGKPCAILVPYRKNRKKSRETELFGIWKDNDKITNVRDYVENLRKARF